MPRIIFLKEDQHPGVPSSIKESPICSESIYDDNRNLVIGVVTYLEGSTEELQGYFRQTGPVWTSNNPIGGVWTKNSV